jgi:hypothetical protein
MKTYEVQWIRCPTNYNPTNLLYVEAVDEMAAETLARDYIKRRLGVGDWLSIKVSEYVPPSASLGRVLEGKPLS